MPSNAQCPDRQTMQLLIAGRGDVSSTERFAEHVGECEDCQRMLSCDAPSDALIASLRRGATALGEVDEHEFDVLIKSLAAHSDTSLAGDTKSAEVNLADTPGAGEETPHSIVSPKEELASFLEPAQEEGELGRIGGFAIRRVLGAGGMGLVAGGNDLQLGRQVAIKVMRRAVAADPVARERFLKEARAMAALEHDHVVPIYQVGESNGVPFFVMPWLKGEPFDARLRRQGRLTSVEIIKLGREAALGLAAAHAVGLIHRDIKPGNLWLETRDSKTTPVGEAWCLWGRTKVLDFGLTREVESNTELTAAGWIAGTPSYMSPEQARGETIDPRTDLFSLGCVLYEAAAGQRPFHASTPTAMALKVVTEQPRRVVECNADISHDLALVIERLLEKDPDRRFQSAGDVAEALASMTTRPTEHDTRTIQHGEGERKRTLKKTRCSAYDRGCTRHDRSAGVCCNHALNRW